MKTDLEIANSVTPRPIAQIADKLNIAPDTLLPYGKYIAKLPLHLIHPEKARQSQLILVSAISPTPAGEGKTTVTIGLSQALCRAGANAVAVLREPSLGPVFGMKGGATGGGYSQVLPMENINLHFTGDFAAVEKAHNLLAAAIDNELYYDNPLGLNPLSILWKRAMDINDRALRNLVCGLGGSANGIPRQTGFDITAASEVMAILCLARNLSDLKQRLGAILIGSDKNKQPVYARQLEVTGAMAVLLKDALLPNLVQTLEGTPALIHGGPFANIAQGANSVLATQMALSLADFAVTEAGFGFDLGGEKFFHIKCRYAGLQPRLVVLVATLKALKYHGGQNIDSAKEPNLSALQKGFENLKRHIENVKKFNLQPFVALNKFHFDGRQELAWVIEECNQLGVEAHVCEVWEKGGEGALALAHSILNFCKKEVPPKLNFLYDLEAHSVEQKIEIIARQIYGAEGVDYQPEALKRIQWINKLELGALPICIAKTQYSFSDNPDLRGVPERPYRIAIRDIEIAAGAGFIVPIAGNMLRMPGLPKRPAAKSIQIDDNGKITGLF
jgi:formate--tetrahydrofolate ligase